MLRALEDAPLGQRVAHLAELPNRLLLQHLHGVVLAGLAVQNEQNFPVGALAEQLVSGEVTDCRLGDIWSSATLHLIDDVLV